jgi:hypothetical protein
LAALAANALCVPIMAYHGGANTAIKSNWRRLRSSAIGLVAGSASIAATNQGLQVKGIREPGRSIVEYTIARNIAADIAADRDRVTAVIVQFRR